MDPFSLTPSDPVEGWRTGYLRIGRGELGGKARGLAYFRDMLAAEFPKDRFPDLDVAVPAFAVLTTEVFDRFVADNGLDRLADGSPVRDREVAERFLAAPLPETVRRTLARLLERVRTPLAVRSSSILEDAIFCPFAGVYETKMIPNNQARDDDRLRCLEDAIRFVMASTFFESAREARTAVAADTADRDDRMAVLVQEIVGDLRGARFYPQLSGVARSHDYYAAGDARPADGVVHLALGLGKTIVDGGVTWAYSPARPKAPPPFASPADMMRNSQLRYWSLNLEAPPQAAPTEDTEFLDEGDLARAESEGALTWVASTYDGRSDRLVPGTGVSGPRVLNFAPLLTLGRLPLNDALGELLAIGKRAAGADVEIEFALQHANERRERPRLGLLQMRPMHVSHEPVTITDDEWERGDALVRSTRVMGNGSIGTIRDIVFVRPDAFDAGRTRAIVAELGRLNRELAERGRPYLLIGFGRWGSSDPWLGIPVDWSQIHGARAIVETTLPSMNVEPSQGSHFFHNIACRGVPYFTVQHARDAGVAWDRLLDRPPREETRFLRHVELDVPTTIKVDGRTGRGAVWLAPGDAG